MKRKIIIILVTFTVLLIVIFLNLNNEETSKEAEEITLMENNSNEVASNSNETENENNIVKVDIKGAVKNPGVYEVDSTYRVIDVINKAGGLTKSANTNYINLSSKVKDEMVIWIYTKAEISEFKLKQSSTQYMISECNCPVVDNTTCLNSNSNSNSNSNKTSNTTNSKININTATVSELMTLNGIGETKAKAIVAYREANGSFKEIKDIMNVSGIGEAAYNKIKDNIEV